MQDKEIITLLCSGSSLGTYIPAMLIDRQLKTENFTTELLVIENYFIEEKRKNINLHKQLFHKNFSAALLSQKLTETSPKPPLDEILVNELLKTWQDEERLKFIVFSGFWMHVVEEYDRRVGSGKISVDTCFMDAEIPLSWKNTKIDAEYARPVWFFSHKEKKLVHKINIAGKTPIPYEERQPRFIVHGGGWGLGTFSSKIPELEKQGLLLDLIVYAPEEAKNIKEGNRAFMVDPLWSPWHRNGKGEHEFPPFAEIKPGGKLQYTNHEEYHEIFDLIRQSRGIVSKPGGATLHDSIAAATPLILLEPFGEHERKNAQLWEDLGYGISYDKWKKMNFSMKLLEEAHLKILEGSEKVTDYVEFYATKGKNKFGQ